jgi:flagellar assembly protein FliH
MQKFNFDRVFTGDGKATEPKPHPRRNYRADEVEAIRAESYAAGERSAVAKTEQLAAQSIGVVAANVEGVLSTLRAELDVIRDQSTRLAAAIARRFVCHMIDKAPELYLERCIEECLDVMHREPDITILIPSGSPVSFKQRLAGMAEDRGLSGSLRIEEGASAKAVTCRLNWRTGGAEISLDDALSRMDQIIEDHICALSGAHMAQQATA